MAGELYRVAPSARRDLDHIFDHIAADNVSAAVGVLEKLHLAFQMVGSQPEMGARRDDLGTDLLQFVPSRPASSYVIFYRRISGGVEIIRVLHGARDLPKHFE